MSKTAKLTVVRSAHNPAQTYDEFKEARLAGFGGSDIGSLLNEGEYSCKRRLFLERLGLMPEGKEDRLSFHMERGKFFEGPVADLFSKRSGLPVSLCGPGYLKEKPFIRANADRLIRPIGGRMPRPGLNDLSGVGVLEVKCPGLFMFKKIQKTGLPKEYILQLQWQMLCYGVSWGAFAVFCAEKFELDWFFVERDEELIQGLILEADASWVNLSIKKDILAKGGVMGALPDKLEPHAKACAKCENFAGCHGSIEFKEGVVIEDPDLAAPAQRLLEVREEARKLEKEKDELTDLIKAQFSSFPCDYINAMGLKIKVSERHRDTIDPKVKKCLTAEQLMSYVRTSSYHVVDIKEAK